MPQIPTIKVWHLVYTLTRSLMFGIGLMLAFGCRPSAEVVVYTALDREFSEPVFREFTQQTGIRVRAKYDTEANKTVGLANLIIAEKQRPRCDLFWNNEILNTLRLDAQGLLAAYQPPSAADFPEQYREPHGRWHGFAARARVLLVNTKLVDQRDHPDSIEDLVDPKWDQRVGVAKPLFGTTATHAACLFAVWGEERAQDYFRHLRQNARVYAGNKQVARAVSAGQIHFGLTDTDDAVIEIENGYPVAIVYPDQGPEDGIGTLFIPNTLAVVAGGPNRHHCEMLVNYLLSPECESQLAAGRSAQIPLHPKTRAAVRVKTPNQVRAMEVDFRTVAQRWDQTSQFMASEFAALRLQDTR